MASALVGGVKPIIKETMVKKRLPFKKIELIYIGVLKDGERVMVREDGVFIVISPYTGMFQVELWPIDNYNIWHIGKEIK